VVELNRTHHRGNIYFWKVGLFYFNNFNGLAFLNGLFLLFIFALLVLSSEESKFKSSSGNWIFAVEGKTPARTNSVGEVGVAINVRAKPPLKLGLSGAFVFSL